jgi:hypothetical protein
MEMARLIPVVREFASLSEISMEGGGNELWGWREWVMFLSGLELNSFFRLVTDLRSSSRSAGWRKNIGHWPTKAIIMRVELSRFIDRTWMISLKQGNIDFNKD